ncbi:PASTA domain-containing protein [Eggerthellaceae bacterium zg-1084]|uniref:PASTA domain-containing protein n=1 Tax=Berryella wangjianweii TaxID=2734634 RepID=UPI001551776D|nr:PASTA domain-containing protein [Berryella wangjianweii]NPD30307.1 PASTA domain-containing protein [Berryella wangjianweii]
MICPHCQNENRDGAKFCNECGAPLNEPVGGAAARAGHEGPDGAGAVALTPTSPTARPAASDAPEAPEAAPACDVAASGEGAGIADGSDGADEEGARPERADAAASGADSQAAQDADPEPDPTTPASMRIADADITTTIDLSGLDASGYGLAGFEPARFRDGQTMEMPPVPDVADAGSKSFLSSSVKERRPKKPRKSKKAKPADDAQAPDAAAGVASTDAASAVKDAAKPSVPSSDDGAKGEGAVAKRSRRRKAVAVVLAVVLLASAGTAAALTYRMELWGGRTVPDVVGMTRADAEAVLGEAGFVPRILEVRSDETEGLVLVMDPEAGAREPRGSEVNVHVSVARTVPDLVGKTKSQAEALLREYGLTGVTFEAERSDEEEGTVLGVSPEPGTRVRAATPIVVRVAEPYLVPDVAGGTLAKAEEALAEAGLKHEVSYSYSEEVLDGTVLGCSPAPGSKVSSDTVVKLNVSRSRGAELIAAAQAYVYAGQQLSVGGTKYEVVALKDVKYLGSSQTAVSFTAKPYISLLGETVYASTRDVSAVISWSDSNTVSSISQG